MAKRLATLADVRRLAAELAPVSDADISAFLEDAASEMNQPYFGDQLSRAHALLAAHYAAIANPQLATAVGPLQSRKVGDVSKTFAAPQVNERGGYEATRFGLEYSRLLRGMGPSVQVI